MCGLRRIVKKGHEGDAREAVHVAHVDAAGVRLVDLVAREAARELLEPDPALEAGEGGAEAEVQAVTEAERDVRRSADVEAIGVVVLALVAVRRGGEQQHVSPSACRRRARSRRR